MGIVACKAPKNLDAFCRPVTGVHEHAYLFKKNWGKLDLNLAHEAKWYSFESTKFNGVTWMVRETESGRDAGLARLEGSVR